MTERSEGIESDEVTRRVLQSAFSNPSFDKWLLEEFAAAQLLFPDNPAKREGYIAALEVVIFKVSNMHALDLRAARHHPANEGSVSIEVVIVLIAMIIGAWLGYVIIDFGILTHH